MSLKQILEEVSVALTDCPGEILLTSIFGCKQVEKKRSVQSSSKKRPNKIKLHS